MLGLDRAPYSPTHASPAPSVKPLGTRIDPADTLTRRAAQAHLTTDSFRRAKPDVDRMDVIAEEPESARGRSNDRGRSSSEYRRGSIDKRRGSFENRRPEDPRPRLPPGAGDPMPSTLFARHRAANVAFPEETAHIHVHGGSEPTYHFPVQPRPERMTLLELLENVERFPGRPRNANASFFG